MRVVLTAANSSVGQAVLRWRPPADLAPPTFVAAVRSARAAEEVRPLLGERNSLAQILYDDPESLDTAFKGACAVVHLAGVLFEATGSTYELANVASTRSVVDAAKRSGVAKVVFVSAIGADEKSSNGYWRTKGEAENIVRASGLAYTVLRVPLLLGYGTEGAAALRRNAGKRSALLIDGGRNLHQPLDVDDLARAIVSAARRSVAENHTLDFVGPVSLPDREIVERASRLMGHQIRVWPIPKALISVAQAVRKRTGRPGISPDVLDVITADTDLDPLPAAHELGIELTPIDEMIKSSLEKRTE